MKPIKKNQVLFINNNTIDIIDKEVFSLTKGLFSLQPSAHNPLDKSKLKNRWIYSPIILKKNPNQRYLNHWVTENNIEKNYYSEKFNIDIEVIEFTEDEYNKYVTVDDNWSYEETKYLFDLCKQFDIRFIVIADRYTQYKRNIEEIKQRYYSVAKQIIKGRNLNDHYLCNFEYDIEYDKIRKYHLEKFLLRPKKKNDEEKALIEELKKIEATIRKEEKEKISLKRVLNYVNKDEDVDESCKEEELNFNKINEEIKSFKNSKKKICFLRGSVMHTQFPFSQKLNKKFNTVLSELNVPAKPLPTEENERIYDLLKEKIVYMFKFQKHLKRIENERRIMDEKLSQKGKINDIWINSNYDIVNI